MRVLPSALGLSHLGDIMQCTHHWGHVRGRTREPLLIPYYALQRQLDHYLRDMLRAANRGFAFFPASFVTLRLQSIAPMDAPSDPRRTRGHVVVM